MENVRIAILDSYEHVLDFMDNDAPDTLHYYDDVLHEYLQGSAYTYTFTCSADHDTSQFLIEGNHISFVYRGKDYFLNIMSTERNEHEITVEAYGLLFELLNEEKEKYSASSAMTFAQYMKVIDWEESVQIILNEVADKKIKHEWTGTDTVLGRIFSLANVFSAEVEFEAELEQNYSLKRIVMRVYKEHTDTVQGIGERRQDITLRYGVDVEGITRRIDIKDLYTAIRPFGKDGLTVTSLNKAEYDANGQLEYSSPSGNRNILAPQARDRYPSNLLTAASDRYIAKIYNYDTDNVNMLYGQALAELKKLSMPKATYEVTGYFDTNIGDTVDIVDEGYTPTLYLNARVTEQERSFTNPDGNKTTFSNIEEEQSEISEELLQRVNTLIQENKVYTCSIVSDNGVVFKNREGMTTLKAMVLEKGVDVTGDFSLKWYQGETELEETSRELTVAAADLTDNKAVYSFQAYDSGVVLRGSYQVTVSNIDDGAQGPKGEKGEKGEQGPQGNPGETGDPGKSVESITAEFYLSPSKEEQTGSEWSEAPPLWEEGKYLWTRYKVAYKDPEEVAYTTPACDSSWEAANQVEENLENSEQEIHQRITDQNADITKNVQEILLQALTEYTTTGDFGEFQSTVESQLKLMSDQMTLQFTQMQTKLNDSNESLQSQLNTITKYFTFDVNGLTIGQADNPYKVIIDNDRYSMTVNGTEVMWIADGKVFTPEIEITKVFKLFGYVIDQDSNGNVNMEYVGGDA